MKKYLMTGMAALAICAAFTSCSKETNVYNPDVIQENEVAKIQKNYADAFVATFGQPAANQDWGFSSAAKTRTWNVNGNQWHDGVNYNYEYDAKVTTDEMNKVFNYVNDKNNVETVDQISFQEYWVSQIWNGKDDANADGVKAPATTTYPNQNGATTTIIGGGQMDKLMIKETTSDDSWIHCNNFNAADNNDWKEGGEGGRTLMTNSGTYSFGYTNSQASYFSTKYIIVPGAKIDASLKDFYYVCFDFERHYVEGEEEKTMGSYEAWNGNNYQGGWNFSLDGHLNEDQVKAAIGQVNGKDIQNINIKGYLYGDKHCDGDDNYTDWIVRISPAKVKSEYNLRIICEDLNATATAADPENSDWDFNDLVLDVKFLGSNKVKMCVVAVGGTLPIRINGEDALEAHGLYGQPTNIMINTGAGAKFPSQAYESNGIPETAIFERTIADVNDTYGNSIKIEVKKGEEWIELTAKAGDPASKMGVMPDFTPCTERQDIRGRYSNFVAWVTTTNPTYWWR